MKLPALDPSYAALGAPYNLPIPATPLPEVELLHVAPALAADLGFDSDTLSNPALRAQFCELMAGNRPWPGYESRASVYSGHQFGVYVPQLGDGRALMLAEIRDSRGQHMELQLKGAGLTPYSRHADGRAVLRSSIREYLCSEAMHALGIPTTRALSLVGSPQPVYRERVETAAVVCRTAPSFVRFGHFEFFYHTGQHERLAPLADHVINEHFPELSGRPDRYVSWLIQVVERTAQLIAQWQAVGFCHGVMNTDNMSVLGLTLDYGPFGFLDAFDFGHICNHSDEQGRYAYGMQPEIAQWNLSRLLQACFPLLSDDDDAALDIARNIYDKYAPAYGIAARQHWAGKLGFQEVREGDDAIINELLSIMHRSKSDFTLSFRKLALIASHSDQPASGVREDIMDIAAFDAWVPKYRARLQAENSDDAERAARMHTVNPLYVLRNHLAQAAIEQAERGNLDELDRLARVLASPYTQQPGMEAYAAPPPEHLRHLEVSCSS
ncbi:MAG TPA: YdiU family protein [Rhodocyclaceae bacterium]|nr:YdiU family protein [Rhodocyclaceae bacterium]